MKVVSYIDVCVHGVGFFDSVLFCWGLGVERGGGELESLWSVLKYS